MPLRQLYPDPGATVKDEAKVDIIAVHGLNPRNKDDAAHTWDTWRTPSGEEGNLWLRDELPNELPDTRIFLYEYNSTAVYGKDRSTFIDKTNALLEAIRIKRRNTPRRPLLLMGHSLGGLLIKQALINAHNNEKYEDIKLSTQGLAFFATPHDDEKQALVNISQIAAKIGQGLGFKKGDNILDTLEKGNMFSDIMHEHWKQQLLNYPIVSFWGTLDTVVPRESTSFGLPGKYENVVALQASHGGVCKFGSSQQDRDNFELVQANVQDLYDQAVANSQQMLAQQTLAQQQNVDNSTRSKQVTKLFRELYKCNYAEAKDRNFKRVEGTCEWFTSHPQFQNWRDGKSSGLLWVSADPGCGKSVLSRYLADEVLQSSPSTTTSYFFFNDDSEDQKSVAGALCCLLRQIFKQRPELLSDAILQQFEEDGDKLPGSFSDLWRILVSVANTCKTGQLVCILDALDECRASGRRILIKTLTEFYRGGCHNVPLRILVTSRPYQKIEQQFNDLLAEIPTIRLKGEDETESDMIQKEIRLVAVARATELAERLRLNEEEREFIKSEITKKSGRTYLWVHLIIEHLGNSFQKSWTSIKEQLQNLPDTINDVYEKILSQTEDKDATRKLLHILVAAVRPFTLEELRVALFLEESHRSHDEIDPEPQDRFQQTIRELCGLFLTIVDNKVYLLHQTVIEFLVGETPASSPHTTEHQKEHKAEHEAKSRLVWKAALTQGSSHRVLGSICAGYLLLEEVAALFQRGDHILPRYEYEWPGDSLHKLFPLLDYSWRNWAVHLREADYEDDFTMKCMMELCKPSRRSCHLSLQIAHLQEDQALVPESLTPLMVASYLGLAPVTRELLMSNTTDRNAKDARGRTALSRAAENGFEAVVQTFIDSEPSKTATIVDVLRRPITRKWRSDLDFPDNDNLPYTDNKTPLRQAVEYGQTGVVKRLLKTKRVKVTTRILFDAATLEDEEILKMLLDTGRFRVNCQNPREGGRTLLHEAASQGGPKVVSYLLSTRAIDINKRDAVGRTALFYSAERQDDTILQLLLDTGECDINSADSIGNTPLSFAAIWGAEACLTRLLATGKADLSARSKNQEGRTPLSLAAGSDSSECVRQLLALDGMDINSRDNCGRTPLSHAVENRYLEVLRLLLDTGKADVNSADDKGRPPLSWSIIVHDPSFLQLWRSVVFKQLLAAPGIEVDYLDGDGRTPLSLAAERGTRDMLEKLLKMSKVHIDTKDRSGRTPVSWCAGRPNGGVDVMQLLCDTGNVDLDSRDNQGRTPLMWACRERNAHIVEFLWETGKVDLESRDNEGLTPLHWACRYWSTDIAKFLWETGKVDLNSRDNKGLSPLLYACKAGQVEVVKMLRDTRQIDVDAEDLKSLKNLIGLIKHLKIMDFKSTPLAGTSDASTLGKIFRRAEIYKNGRWEEFRSKMELG